MINASLLLDQVAQWAMRAYCQAQNIAVSTCLVQVDDLRKQLVEATRLSFGDLLS